MKEIQGLVSLHTELKKFVTFLNGGGDLKPLLSLDYGADHWPIMLWWLVHQT